MDLETKFSVHSKILNKASVMPYESMVKYFGDKFESEILPAVTIDKQWSDSVHTITVFEQFNNHYINFTREEITHTVYSMLITAEDYAYVQLLNNDEMYSWIVDQDEHGGYYQWSSGKEYCEGEGERGMFEFSVDTYTPNGSRLERIDLDKPAPEPDYETDPNGARSHWAGIAIAAFVDKAKTDPEDVLSDLLCDLMHWADEHSQKFDTELHRACQHYDAEVAEA